MTTNFETISVDKSGVGFFYKKETDSEHFVPSSWRSRTSPTTLPGTELSRDFSKVTVDTSRTLGGMLKKKHSTSYFPGTGKKAWASSSLRNGTRGIHGEHWRLYNLDIHLTTQKYFQLFSGSWNETVQVPTDASWGESQAAEGGFLLLFTNTGSKYIIKNVSQSQNKWF